MARIEERTRGGNRWPLRQFRYVTTSLRLTALQSQCLPWPEIRWPGKLKGGIVAAVPAPTGLCWDYGLTGISVACRDFFIYHVDRRSDASKPDGARRQAGTNQTGAKDEPEQARYQAPVIQAGIMRSAWCDDKHGACTRTLDSPRNRSRQSAPWRQAPRFPSPARLAHIDHARQSAPEHAQDLRGNLRGSGLSAVGCWLREARWRSIRPNRGEPHTRPRPAGCLLPACPAHWRRGRRRCAG